MKIVYALSTIQLLVIVFLAFKIISLENQFDTITTAITTATTNDSQNSVIYKSLDNDKLLQTADLSLENIRLVVRKELQTTLSNLEFSNQSSKNPEDILAEIPSDPQRIDIINDQLEYFMSDGEFSTEELGQVETTLVTMNYDDRQRVLLKMAQAMNKAKINFNN